MKLFKTIEQVKNLSHDEKKAYFDKIGVRNYSNIEASYLPENCIFIGYGQGGEILDKETNLPLLVDIPLINDEKEEKSVTLEEFEKLQDDVNNTFVPFRDKCNDFRHLRIYAKNVIETDVNEYSVSNSALTRSGKLKTDDNVLTEFDLSKNQNKTLRVIGTTLNPFLSRNPITLTEQIVGKKFTAKNVQFFNIPFGSTDIKTALEKVNVVNGYQLTENFD